MKNFNWKKSFSSICLKHEVLNAALGPVDEAVLSAALLRIRSAENAGPVTVVCSLSSQAERLEQEVRAWIDCLGLRWRTDLLPEGASGAGSLAVSDTESSRSKVLYRALTDPPDFLFASVAAVLSPVPAPERLLNTEIVLRTGQEISPEKLSKNLVEMDYDDELEVSVPGEFARHGGIVDVYSLSEEYPARLEYFGDEIESIRLFHPETQRSFQTVEEYRVILRGEAGSSRSKYLQEGRQEKDEEKIQTDFFSYLKKNGMCVAGIFPAEIEKRLVQFCGEETCTRWLEKSSSLGSRFFSVLDASEVANFEGKNKQCRVEKFPLYPANAAVLRNLPEGSEDSFAELARQVNIHLIQQWLSEKIRVFLLGSSENSCVQIREWLKDACLEKTQNLFTGKENLPCSVFSVEERFACVTERDLFAVSSRGWKNRQRGGRFAGKNGEDACVGEDVSSSGADSVNEADLSAFSDLEEGDYAVHVNHGICIYRGLVMVKAGGAQSEMIALEFADGMMLHIPVWQAHCISRYIGAKKGAVQLNKLHSAKWGKTKAAAAASIRNLAFDMLKLQAVRSKALADAFPPDDLNQRLFEESFPFQETPDQLRSTEEIKRDMESSKPMDRLLCGDVGYGKTEVAMRAAYKCVSAGRQVAILVPTTVLAQQHYYSFLERFAGTAVLIEQLSRFRTKKEQAQILERMKNGSVDIVIGTHVLVHEKVAFKNLGLIIIDEEQRFGVVQKERLKHLRATVDVLTMTATPIPRTLYLSMAGIRDLSTIMSAPVQRLPVQTIVAQWDEGLIRNAVARELQRGGQVYYLFNRVSGIEEEALRLQNMFPEARIGIGHGRMPEEELEQVMSDFIEGKLDILVSTTIIESGLDIPNANTILIDRADRFGLAELYQLRGRVGRWTRQAYAYMLLPRSGILTGDARKRIAAIRRYTHLGAGFKLAMRDLEIRGSGNILGAEQSGQMNAIGFNLYCQLLRSCVAQFKGEIPEIRHECDVFLDFLDYSLIPAEGHIAACFPENYIDAPRLRIDAYRKLAGVSNLRDLDRFELDLRDRYGVIPPESVHLLLAARIRLIAGMAKLDSVSCRDGRLYMEKGSSVIKPDGLIPRVPMDKKPEERLKWIASFMEKLFL